MKYMPNTTPSYGAPGRIYRGAEELGARFRFESLEPDASVEVIPTEGPSWNNGHAAVVSIAALEVFVDAVRAERARR